MKFQTNEMPNKIKWHTNEMPNKIKWTHKWNAKQMTCHTKEMPNKWHAIQMKCQTNYMPYKWNAKQMKCHTNEMLAKWNSKQMMNLNFRSIDPIPLTEKVKKWKGSSRLSRSQRKD